MIKVFSKINILALAVALLVSSSALAAEGKYYTGDKVRGHDKGQFVVLDSDDVNLRAAPETGRIIKVLERHALMRVLDKEGQWYRVNVDGTDGYIYAPFTIEGLRDGLTDEDFALGYTTLNSRFNEDEAAGQLGKPVRVTRRDGRVYYEYKDLTIGSRCRNKEIEYLEVRDPKIITMRGVSVGDDSARVVGQYGLPDGVVYGNDGVRYEYFFKDSHKDDYCFYVDIAKNGRVAALVLEKE